MAFCARMRARWQRLKRGRRAPTLISSSQCTHWCIDCCADQLETFCLGEQMNKILLSGRPKDHAYLSSLIQMLPFYFVSGKPLTLSVFFFFSEMLTDTVLTVLCELRWQQLCFCWEGASILLLFLHSWNHAELKMLIEKNCESGLASIPASIIVNSSWIAELWI